MAKTTLRVDHINRHNIKCLQVELGLGQKPGFAWVIPSVSERLKKIPNLEEGVEQSNCLFYDLEGLEDHEFEAVVLMAGCEVEKFCALNYIDFVMT